MHWMRSLAEHFRFMRSRYPADQLAIVFDIDGTIVDPRDLVVHVLHSYDRHHGTRHFHGLTAEDVMDHETNIDEILERITLLPVERRRDIRAWYLGHLRDPDAMAAAHRPYQGVLAVIRWFQLQPRTDAALNTGRPESMRELTLTSLNALGATHKVRFRSELLMMNRSGWDDVELAKVENLRSLQRAGYRIVAVVDNEPALIGAMAAEDGTGEILFLHADTIFSSRREPTPRTVSGTAYELRGLIDEDQVGRRVTLAWHGVNGRHNLQRFLASEVRWAEIDVRRDPIGRLVLRHDSFRDTPWTRDEQLLTLEDCLEALAGAARSVKLDLKEVEVVDGILASLHGFGFTDDRVWFNGCVEALGRSGFATLRAARPLATLQAPIDFLVPLLLAAPDLARDVSDGLRQWGIDRVSLDWRTPGMSEALDGVERLGWDVNIYGVPDLETFLEAALLLPTSLTADFNFPEWSYDGRGPDRAVANAAI